MDDTDEPTSPQDLRRRLPALGIRDGHRLRRRLDGVRRDDAPRLAAIERELVKAEEAVARRRASMPQVRYPDDLPIVGRREELLELIEHHQVVVVAGETGSGKSTQLPKLCLELGRGVRGLIGHTQPRRIAARSVSERIAEELGGEVGGTVGYTVRFSDQVGEDTLVKVMTDGILLAETRRDRDLLAYDTLIIDEAHERSLNIDFLLGYVKQLLPRRPDLKVIITSATIDTAKFAKHFGTPETGDAPIVEVSGRTYPVEVRYQPFGEEADEPVDQTQAIAEAVRQLHTEGPGDVLVFLSGEREIHDTADALRRLELRDTEILPLYARLTSAEQRRIFQPHRGRRLVLSTNVAETSLTVPGVRYVVDTGTARISRYSRRLKVQRLPIEPISQASANQRAGRCGRVAPGICIRLFSQEDFEAREPFTEPEILRTNLASVILQAASLDLGDIADFPFVDPPDARAIKDGVALLEELGAFEPVDDGGTRLTALGRRLAQLPIDPRLARMVLEAERNDCVREVMIITAGLSIQDPRERPAEKQQAADAMHARFRGEGTDGSDFLGYVKLWEHVREQQKTGSKSEFRKMCKAEFLNYLRIREWQDINRQLREVVVQLKIKVNDTPAEPDRVHLALLAGLLSHLGMRTTSEREFMGARNAKFVIANGSALAKKPPKWVMAAELVETNRLYARCCARIQPEWAERVGGHLCKRTYSDPRWDASRGSAACVERVTLYGLPLVPGRTVDYARIDPAAARDLFIRHALVEGNWTSKHAFIAENKRRIAELRAMEDRARRRDLVIGEEQLVDLFDARIPHDVTTQRHFDRWWKQEQRTRPQLLCFTTAELTNPDAGAVNLLEYPDTWEQGGRSFRLSYIFEPGNPIDGVLCHLPLSVLNQVSAAGFDWHVPGRRAELVELLMRAVPKNARRYLTPITQHVDAFLAQHGPSDGWLLDVLCAYVNKVILDTTKGAVVEAVLPSEIDLDRVPEHAQITFTVDDDQGRPIAVDKDLAALRQQLAPKVRGAIAEAVAIEERTGLTAWSFGTIPRTVRAQRAGNVVNGFPSLVDEGPTVGLRVFATVAEQERFMRAGTRRLLLLTINTPRKALERLVPNDARLALARVGYGTLDQLVDDCITCALDELIDTHGGPAWDEAGFAALRDDVRSDLADRAEAIVRRAAPAISLAGAITQQLDTMRSKAFDGVVADVSRQLRWLVHAGFVASTGASRLNDLVRYLKAAQMRLDKLGSETAKDAQRTNVVQRLEGELDDLLLAAPPSARRDILAVRWLVEELRVSLFAQSLGTSVPVSEARILKELAKLGSLV